MNANLETGSVPAKGRNATVVVFGDLSAAWRPTRPAHPANQLGRSAPANSNGGSMTDESTEQTTGRIKEAAGTLAGNRRLKNEGRLEQAGSSIKHAVDHAVDKVTDALKGHNSNDRRN